MVNAHVNFNWFSHQNNYIENNTWVRGNTRFISSVEHIMFNANIMFNTRNKSGISKHPCIFLFII